MNKFFGRVVRFFGLAIAALVLSFALNSEASAQTNNLYYSNGGAYFGQITVIPGSHFQIRQGNSVIKTFRNSCQYVDGKGTLLCTFGQWDSSGTHIYSGKGYFYTSGYVYLRWTNQNTAGVWRQIDSGWIGLYPK